MQNKTIRLAILTLILLFPLYDQGFAATARAFRDGDVVCFLGDSITHGGRYHTYILEYYATRYPDRRLTFVNRGISGDTATGSDRRMDRDVLLPKPTIATIMLGMNDVNRGLYGKEHPDEKNLKMRGEAQTRYREAMKRISDRFLKENVEIIYITPSPYDQVADLEANNLFGVNDALGICADFCREQAREKDAGLIDFHQPMTAMIHQTFEADPSATIIGRDRVHPGGLGHYMMAYHFLKAQGVDRLVSSLAIDYASGKLTSAENCAVTELRSKNGVLSFYNKENALPLHSSEAYIKADELAPLTDALNNEIIQVANLPEGSFTLYVDGQKVVSHNAATWEKGVNIAPLATPMQDQSARIHKLIEDRRLEEAKLRLVVQVEAYMRYKGTDPEDAEASEAYLQEREAQLSNSIYHLRLYRKYREYKDKTNEFEQNLQALTEQIYKENKPVTHHFELKPGRPTSD